MASRGLSGQVLDEKYRIERLLGAGGMGAVYLATHLGTGRPVAVKVIVPQFMKHEEFVERFKREARAAGRLRHPNVVDVTDFGFARVGTERVAYLVMEYLDGCTLAEVLDEEKQLPLNWVVDILEQACSALDEAHQQGIVHRDLKPDNIWLEPNRRGGYTVKVLDFGIAKLGDSAPGEAAPGAGWANPRDAAEHGSSLPLKAVGQTASLSSSEAATLTGGSDEEASTMLLPAPAPAEERTRMLARPITDADRSAAGTASVESLTRVGSILGTPLYMSPEQCRGERSDARSDIYSLGVIAYQMLAGRTPFKGDLASIMKQHMETQAAPIREKRVPRKTAALIMSALSKEPDERPATAAAFAAALRAQSEGAGLLLRRALTLYSDHLPTFLRLALIIYAPLVAINLLGVANTLARSHRLLTPLAAEVLGVLLALLSTLTAFVTASVNIGVTTRLVTQLFAAPLRPLHLRPAFHALKRRLRPILTTTLLVSLLTMVGVVLGLVPGLIIMVNYSLVTSVLMMEEKRGRAAMRRAKELSKRNRQTVVKVVFIQLFGPILLSVTVALIITAIIKALEVTGSRATAFSSIYQIIFLPISIFIGSFGALLTALLYLKMRQAGGETPREVLGQFEEDELPRRNWQLRMRSHISTRH